MQDLQGLSSETTVDYFRSTSHQVLLEKAQGNSKDHDQKEVTWNKREKSVELLGQHYGFYLPKQLAKNESIKIVLVSSSVLFR